MKCCIVAVYVFKLAIERMQPLVNLVEQEVHYTETIAALFGEIHNASSTIIAKWSLDALLGPNIVSS